MTYPIPLDKMTPEEIIQVMESTWDDLCARADTIPSPSWHEDMLADRETAMSGGDEAFEDWETAKAKIMKQEL
jgi:hypothetical protein